MPFFRLVLMGFIAVLLVACSEEEQGYKYEVLVEPSPFHGIHGIGTDDRGRLLAGSVVGGTIYQIHPRLGRSKVYIGPPEGEADDIALAPDGTLAWTAFLQGRVYARHPDGELQVVAEGYIGANSLAFDASGRLFFTQVFAGDALYEAYFDGRPPRKIMEGMGGLNGFEFGKDGKLYGPLWFKKQVVRVDVNAAEIEVIATGFEVPAAVNFGPEGNLWVVDTALGHVIRINLETGEKKVVSQVKPAIDNLAFDNKGRLFISNMADNAIIEIDKENGDARTVTSGALAVAADIASMPGEDMIYVADVFALRKVDAATGEVSEVARMFGDELDYPIGISVSDDYIAVAGWSSGAVQVFDRASEKSLSLLHGFTLPTDVLLLPDGSLLVAEYASGRLYQLSGEGWSRKRIVAGQFGGPSSLALAPDGKIYVAEYQRGRVSTIELDTGRRAVFADNLSSPEGLHFRDDGSLLVAEVGKQRIVHYTHAGHAHHTVDNLPIGAPGPEAVPAGIITGVATDSAGQIIFSSDIDSAIYRVTK